jgi:hypothetical protein
MTINKQSAASIIRQILGVVATAFGVLTSSVSSLHLPVAISTILTACGPLILVVEHYVGDPSTGNTPTTTTYTATPTTTYPTMTTGSPQTLP